MVDEVRFTVRIADAHKPHNACFGEFAAALRDALRANWHDVTDSGGRLILLGANEAGLKRDDIPEDAILYNAEQIALAPKPEALIARIDRVIWDYSEVNVDRWRALGAKRVVLCPVGYVSSMATIEKDKEDIDVLFYGWVNERRRAVLDDLMRVGLRVMTLTNHYGTIRDRWIARSKVVLNLHYLDEGIFEIFRVSHLLANRKCVVSEAGGRDPTLETLASRACHHVHREEIPTACKAFVKSEALRRKQETKGFSEFQRLDLVANVRHALHLSGV